ncbi:PQQ-binding-like beta-propeller repeat protein [Streptomyces purpureus]|uniref:outer membrane protein assembly factor BamB family protein n=1 Tax=Streptomyces purpureus TaxID=1951 RepID=UPI000361EAB3|nr:PQQ-binding-like beta-propeller repeat protein [Streptomyces purpureus]
MPAEGEAGTGDTFVTAPVVAAGAVYVNGTADDPHVQALDAATGRPKWTSSVTGGGALLIAGGTLYVRKGKGSVYALDAATGARPTR